MTGAGKPRPPAGLGPAGRRFWSAVLVEFELTAAQLEVLRVTCECLDRLAEARATVERDGAYLPMKAGGFRPHPALAVERDSRIGFLRGQRELGITAVDPDESRPVAALPGRRV